MRRPHGKAFTETDGSKANDGPKTKAARVSKGDFFRNVKLRQF